MQTDAIPPLPIPAGGWMRAEERASARSSPYYSTYVSAHQDSGWMPSTFTDTYLTFLDACAGKNMIEPSPEEFFTADTGMVAF